MLLAGCCVTSMSAQGRPGGNGGRSGSRTTQSTRQGSARQGSSARPSSPSRPTVSTRPASKRQEVVQSSRPQRHGTSSAMRPTGTRPTGTQPGGQRPSGNNQGSAGVRPGSSSGNRPSAPGHGNHGNMRPGGDNRPGGSAVRPGGGNNHRPGAHGRPGSSVPRPGGWNPVVPPHNSWARPGYRPPRPGGGYWGPPAPSRFRIGYWAPPLPPRYTYARVGVPTIGTILGLAFGSFIDAGINSLYNAGYSVAGYADNIIYLTNVTQLGLIWPQVSMNYTNGLLTNSQFSYYSAIPDTGRFNMTYTQLCMLYGSPVANTGSTVTWWAGDNTGYITLNYSFMSALSGVSGYYTTLTYSAYY